MVPVKDLMLLVRDYEVGKRPHGTARQADICDTQPIAKNVFTILINISHDAEVLEFLTKDDKFIEELLRKITVRSNLHHNLCT